MLWEEFEDISSCFCGFVFATIGVDFWPRAQMGLRCGVRARVGTVSSTEYRSPNAGRVGT